MEYTNKAGSQFQIEIEMADVPENADYFGYLFIVKVNNNPNEIGHVYKALVKKELCDNEEKANIWLRTIALDFLHTILETYANGKTWLLIPNSDKWWVI
jgi:hypothetical protein